MSAPEDGVQGRAASPACSSGARVSRRPSSLLPWPLTPGYQRFQPPRVDRRSQQHLMVNFIKLMMSDQAEDRTAHVSKKRESHHLGWKEPQGRTKNSVSAVTHVDEPRRHRVSHQTIQLENTYQLGPARRFPAEVVNNLLKDVLTNYLTEKSYELDFSRQMTKMISEVIKAQVKDLIIPRYKLIVIVHIGQLNNQSILIGSRCLWDPKNDTFSSYVFRNSSLFAFASVYAIYFE